MLAFLKSRNSEDICLQSICIRIFLLPYIYEIVPSWYWQDKANLFFV